MKNLLPTLAMVLITPFASSLAAEGSSSPYTDAVGDIDPGIANGDGTLDILGMEVTNDATDLTFTLTLNGNISSTDWGNFMIGIATGSTTDTDTGNGWSRPMNLNSPIGGMDYWIGSWVNGGGGNQFWSYTGSGTGGGTDNNWSGPGTISNLVLSPGSTSNITYTVSLASLGLSVGDTFYFDAYSSGGGSTDGAVDALANPNVSITSWSQTYVSSTTGTGGLGLNSYQIIPEPTTLGILGLAAAGFAGYVIRRRSRK